jgi:tRNA-Thr(GGU) m(6)t(6)A37 methyltransferase TsaA
LGIVSISSISYNLYLHRKLQKIDKLRQSERKGRINSEKDNRLKQNNHYKAKGYNLKIIGAIESPFPDRRGTPRQPILVPAARGKIKFDKKIIQNPDYFQEIQEFSHVWIIWIFSENTTVSNKNKSCSARIAPPRLNGKKVGCLSTRSPHRPNAIGLSICEIISIGKDYIEISGLDMVDKTPVLDIKPVIPYDFASLDLKEISLPMLANTHQTSLKVPDWIIESDIKLRSVEFNDGIINKIKPICNNEDAIRIQNLIIQVLRQDPRGLKDRGSVSNTSYECRLDGLQLYFHVDQDIIKIDKIDQIK